MAQNLHDDAQVHALGNQERGARVAQVMDAPMGEAGSAQDAAVASRDTRGEGAVGYRD